MCLIKVIILIGILINPFQKTFGKLFLKRFPIWP